MKGQPSTGNPVIATLKRRGFKVLTYNPKDYLIFPPGWDIAFEDALYEILKKYSFRIFIRDVIKNRKSFRVDDLLKYSTKQWVEKYIDFLLKRGIVEEIGEARFRLKSPAVFSFGDTLEWFVAKVFEKEFTSPALWGIRMSGARAGGDYDVIAFLEGNLVYVEVKSSPPKNVEEVEIAAFLKRVEELRPKMAIFIEDTKLRMKDKIVPFFEGLLKKKGLKVKRLKNEIFSVEGKVFITNSAPDIVNNLGFCIRQYLQPKEFW